MTNLDSLPSEILAIIFGFFFAQLEYVTYLEHGAYLTVPILPDGLQLLLTCRRMRDFGMEQWLERTMVFVEREHYRLRTAWCPGILAKCPWGAGTLVLDEFDEPRIIRKMCQRFSLLYSVNWLTSVHIHLDSYSPLPAKLDTSDLLRLLEQDERFSDIASCWIETIENVVPRAEIGFRVTRQACCEDHAEVSHLICGVSDIPRPLASSSMFADMTQKFVLYIEQGDYLLRHDTEQQTIYARGSEDCSCSRKYRLTW